MVLRGNEKNMNNDYTNINLKIDKELLTSIKFNAEEIGNSTTKEINEMLWLALKPRSEQIKKVLAIRASTTRQINNNAIGIRTQSTEEYTDEDYDRFLNNL